MKNFLKTLVGTGALLGATMSQAAIDTAAVNTELGVAEAAAHSVGTIVIGIAAGLVVISIVMGLVKKL